MRYQVGDKFVGVCSDGSPFVGHVEKVSLPNRKYFIVWRYEDAENRQSWYSEAWVVDYTKRMEYEPLKIVTFDEELFTI
jgi:hypothetical protein